MDRKIDTKTYVETAGTVVINESEKNSLPSNIPSPKGFIGREVELTALRSSTATAFVLHGAGGVGKTELALEFIHQHKPAYRVHIRVDMRGLSDKLLTANDAKLEVLRAFNPGVPADLSEQDINNRYVSFLNQHKTILFFDNAKERKQVESLNDPAALVVITSRETFNVTGGFSKEIEQMSPEDARNLLYSIANETRFDGQTDALAYLAGYLPMALLPLASLLADDVTLEAKDLAQRYADRKERLRLADPNRANLSVEASFELSYETLSDELKERWRKLAVFPADFDLEALQFVWQIEDGKAARAELIKKHLLEFDKTTKRSILHDLARDYANEKMSVEELFQTQYIHCYYFGWLFASLNKVTLQNLDKFDLERTNIEQGFVWLSDKVELNNAFAELCAFYVGYLATNQILSLRLHFREYIKWLETGLKASRSLNKQQQISNGLGDLGNAYASLGEYRKAIEYHEAALLIAQEIGDRQGEGNLLGNLGNAYNSLGEYQKAIEYHEASLLIAQEIGDRQGEGSELGNLGIAYRSLGEYQKAIEYHEAALLFAQEIGDRQGEGSILGNLGVTYRSLGEYRKAIEYYEAALLITKEIGDRRGKGNHLGNLGNAYLDLGEKEMARKYYLESLAILEVIESPYADKVRMSLERLEN